MCARDPRALLLLICSALPQLLRFGMLGMRVERAIYKREQRRCGVNRSKQLKTKKLILAQRNSRQVVVDGGVLRVALQVLPVDQALDSLLHIRRLPGVTRSALVSLDHAKLNQHDERRKCKEEGGGEAIP